MSLGFSNLVDALWTLKNSGTVPVAKHGDADAAAGMIAVRTQTLPNWHILVARVFAKGSSFLIRLPHCLCFRSIDLRSSSSPDIRGCFRTR